MYPHGEDGTRGFGIGCNFSVNDDELKKLQKEYPGEGHRGQRETQIRFEESFDEMCSMLQVQLDQIVDLAKKSYNCHDWRKNLGLTGKGPTPNNRFTYAHFLPLRNLVTDWQNFIQNTSNEAYSKKFRV